MCPRMPSDRNVHIFLESILFNGFCSFRYNLDARNTSLGLEWRRFDPGPYNTKLGSSSLDGGDSCCHRAGQQTLSKSHGVPHALSSHATNSLLLQSEGCCTYLIFGEKNRFIAFNAVEVNISFSFVHSLLLFPLSGHICGSQS